MAFNDFRNKREEPIDDTRHLFCTEAGCGQLWTINLGRPLCSQHQWKDDKPFVYAQYTDFGQKYFGDPKGWAKRIVDKHEMGLPVAKIALEFAQEALR